MKISSWNFQHLLITCLCKFDSKILSIFQMACPPRPILAKTLNASSDRICWNSLKRKKMGRFQTISSMPLEGNFDIMKKTAFWNFVNDSSVQGQWFMNKFTYFLLILTTNFFYKTISMTSNNFPFPVSKFVFGLRTKIVVFWTLKTFPCWHKPTTGCPWVDVLQKKPKNAQGCINSAQAKFLESPKSVFTP